MSEPNWLRKRCFSTRAVIKIFSTPSPGVELPGAGIESGTLSELQDVLAAYVRRCNTIAILKQQCGVK